MTARTSPRRGRKDDWKLWQHGDDADVAERSRQGRRRRGCRPPRLDRDPASTAGALFAEVGAAARAGRRRALDDDALAAAVCEHVGVRARPLQGLPAQERLRERRRVAPPRRRSRPRRRRSRARCAASCAAASTCGCCARCSGCSSSARALLESDASARAWTSLAACRAPLASCEKRARALKKALVRGRLRQGESPRLCGGAASSSAARSRAPRRSGAASRAQGRARSRSASACSR